MSNGRVAIIGPIRQELLSGINDRARFEKVRDGLRSFPDIALLTADYENAAHYYNVCRAKGIQGSMTDFLICAVAVRNKLQVFTTDGDFEHYRRHLPIALIMHLRRIEDVEAGLVEAGSTRVGFCVPPPSLKATVGAKSIRGLRSLGEEGRAGRGALRARALPRNLNSNGQLLRPGHGAGFQDLYRLLRGGRLAVGDEAFQFLDGARGPSSFSNMSRASSARTLLAGSAVMRSVARCSAVAARFFA